MDRLKVYKKKQSEKEKSLIASLKSESEVESECESIDSKRVKNLIKTTNLAKESVKKDQAVIKGVKKKDENN